MSEKPDTSASELTEKLRAVLVDEFAGVGDQTMADVLVTLADELRRPEPVEDGSGDAATPTGRARGDDQGDDRDEAATSWTGGIANRVSRALIPTSTDDIAGGKRVQLRAEAAPKVASILHQCIEIGALLIDFDTPPALNATVVVQIDMPNSHLSVETHGRVVHTSERGTAIEVSSLDREDRVAMEGLLEDFREYLPSTEEPSAPREDGGAVSDTDLEDQREEKPVDPVRANQTQGGVFRREQQDDLDAESSFVHSRRPSSSIAIGALKRESTGRRGDFQMRRQVELTDPDVQVITSTQKALGERIPAGETFGPGISWLEPKADPDRVESLSGERVVDILLQLSESGFTGILEVESDEVSRQVYFDGGLIVEFAQRPRQPREELGPMLHMADRITHQQLSMAAAHADENSVRFERSLLELEILDHDPIRHAIAGRLTYLTRDLTDLEDGEARIYDSDSLPAGYLPAPPLRVHVPIERIVYRRFFERLRQLNAEERDELIDSHLDAYPEIVPADRDRLERAVLDDAHEQLVERLLSGRRRLREVFTESNMSPAETFAVVYALHRMGVARFDTSLHKTIVRERFRENVTVKYLSVHKASYFEVLNVHWSSYDEVIEKAYHELEQQFDPEDVPPSMEDEVHTRVSEIAERIQSAYQILKSRKHRHAYRKRIMPEYKLQHAVPLFIKQSELAERRNQWSEARDALRRVLEIEPSNEQAQLRLERIEEQDNEHLSADPSQSNF
ncbi:MAG: DUF4388 domain-containing protein [Myxococcota bacterium]